MARAINERRELPQPRPRVLYLEGISFNFQNLSWRRIKGEKTRRGMFTYMDRPKRGKVAPKRDRRTVLAAMAEAA